MIVLGVILLALGGLLAYFGRARAGEVAFWAGVLIAVGGAILFVLGILHEADVETAFRSSWG